MQQPTTALLPRCRREPSGDAAEASSSDGDSSEEEEEDEEAITARRAAVRDRWDQPKPDA